MMEFILVSTVACFWSECSKETITMAIVVGVNKAYICVVGNRIEVMKKFSVQRQLTLRMVNQSLANP